MCMMTFNKLLPISVNFNISHYSQKVQQTNLIDFGESVKKRFQFETCIIEFSKYKRLVYEIKSVL